MTEEQRDCLVTYLNEPEAWLTCKSGRSVEICKESSGMNYPYYSIRLHCTEDEYDQDEELEECNGVMECATAEYSADNLEDLVNNVIQAMTDWNEAWTGDGAWYQVIYGSGLVYPNAELVRMDEKTTDYGAVMDKAIDQIDSRNEGTFLDEKDLQENGGDYYPDEYVIGGNYGKKLLTYGTLDIREILFE